MTLWYFRSRYFSSFIKQDLKIVSTDLNRNEVFTLQNCIKLTLVIVTMILLSVK